MGIEPLKTQQPGSSGHEDQDKAKDEQDSGWDPYQVWRTRVLLPRLSNERARPAQRAPSTIESRRAAATPVDGNAKSRKPRLKQVG